MSKTSIAPIPLSSQIALDNSRWQVALILDVEKPPCVTFTGPALRARQTYLVTQLMDATAAGRSFGIGDRDKAFHFGPVAVAAITKEALERTPKTLGRLRAIWEPDDPNVPF